MIKDLAGLVAIILSLGIPVAAIICTVIAKIKKRNADVELRKAIVENNVDAETAKVIISEQTPAGKQSRRFGNLTVGLTFVGAALGTLIPLLCGLPVNDVIGAFTLCGFIALGIGVALFAAFLIIWKLRTKTEAQENSETQEKK